MSTTCNLSNDLLLLIFKNLNISEQKQCQFVCRAWYLPAHLCVLTEIMLKNSDEVEKFIKFIDCNPDPSYLRAVKKISVDTDYVPGVRFSKEKVKKLFLRFPNLEHVFLHNCSTWFNTEFMKKEFCEEMLKVCSKMDTFKIHTDLETQPDYCDVVYDYRHITTKLQFGLPDVELLRRYGGLVEFVTSFPQCKSIDYFAGPFNTNFQELLPVFGHLENLKSIDMWFDDEDDENFVENYLQTKSDNDKSLIMKRLSNVKRLYVECPHEFYDSSIDFIAKYLTGLEYLALRSCSNTQWATEDDDLLCGELLNLACFAKDKSFIDFEYMLADGLTRCFPTIIDKIFRQLPSSQLKKTNRVLELHTQNGEIEDTAYLSLEEDKKIGRRRIAVLGRQEILERLFETTSFD